MNREKMAAMNLAAYRYRIGPTTMAYLLLLHEASRMSDEYSTMTSFELEAFAHKYTHIHRNSITANMRRLYKKGLVTIEYVGQAETGRSFCCQYGLTAKGHRMMEEIGG